MREEAQRGGSRGAIPSFLDLTRHLSLQPDVTLRSGKE